MDLRSRYDVPDEVLHTLVDRVQAQIHTMIPVKVVEDSDGHTTHIQPLIKWVQRMPDGSQKLNEYPPIKDAPNNFPSGGGTTMTVPIKKGDLGYALVASRSIDVWHEKGGTQPQVDARMHDLSDAIYVPGLKDTPSKLKNVSKTSAQLRSNDGKHVFDMHPKNGPTMSADEGKHVVSAHPKNGIGIKTSMKLAVDATKGMDVKGATHFMDGVSSDKSFSAPSLNGQVGNGFQGMANGVIGALIGAGLMLALASGSQPGDGVQRVRFAFASAWSR